MRKKLLSAFHKVKMPKRCKKLFDTIDEVEAILDYYMTRDKSRPLRRKLEDIKKVLEELSVEQKEHDIRLIKKWEQRQKAKLERDKLNGE